MKKFDEDNKSEVEEKSDAENKSQVEKNMIMTEVDQILIFSSWSIERQDS